MPAATEPSGLRVEIGRIDRELKKLWEQGAGAMTRASLMNLAIYSEVAGSLAGNTELISQISQDHACRAIVIEIDPTARENRAQAWISAHCHVGHSGSKQICSEQLSFLLGGPCANLVPSIVFSQLDSDLPFYLWWQGDFHEPVDPQLWTWVDRVIYDSARWTNFDGQMQLVEIAQTEASHRMILCDLNWTRLDRIRLAVAQFFDHPASHHHFGKLNAVEIGFAPGYRSTALLLTGWLAAQLRWKLKESQLRDRLIFADQSGRNIAIDLRETPGEVLPEIILRSASTEFCVRHADGADLLQVSRSDEGATRLQQLLPAGSNDPAQLLSDELARGGPHSVYCRVVSSIRSLL